MQLIERRIGLLFALFLLLFFVIGGRAVYLNIAKAGKLKEMAAGQQVSRPSIPAPRGRIVDRNGKELAVTEDATTVFATPYLVKNPLRAAQRIAPILKAERNELFEKLSARRRGFVYLARQIDPYRAARVKKLGFAGIEFLDEPRRTYPQGTLAGQIVGGVGVDRKGLFGLEFALDGELRGQDGQQRVVKGADGEPISLVETKEMRAGQEVQLTIDAVIQARAESVLEQTVKQQSAKRAAAVVIDPQSGDVLAMTSWPRVDPNRPTTIKPESTKNLATGFTYEPGSTYKAVTVAAALEEGLVKPQTEITCGSQVQVYDRVISNAMNEPGGTYTVAKVLAQSVNTCTVGIGQKVGRNNFDRYVRKFGYGSPTKIDYISGEEAGLVLEPERYSGPTLANMSIGQGLSVTPIQMIRTYAAIANGGILRTPRLVKRVGQQQIGREDGHRVMREQTAQWLRQMLKGVLGPGGTARQANIPGYEIAGKTGTAEKVINGAYSKSAFVASFVGFAPVADPRLLTMVIVDEPVAQFGGVVAAPAFEQINSFALPYLGIAPSTSSSGHPD